MKKMYLGYIVVCFFILSAVIANDYPSDKDLWKSFNSTPGSRVHVNRVFVRPDVPLHKDKKLRTLNDSLEKSNVRFRKRRAVRKQILDRIYSNLVPGEQVFMLFEKYDFYHENCYFATLVTQRNMYYVEAYENLEKGTSILKYPLNEEEYANFSAVASTVKNSHGSCEMTDSRNYPAFLSVKQKNGKWETAVCSAAASVWSAPQDKQSDYFKKTSVMMKVISELKLLRNSRIVPPVLVKK